MVICAGTAVSFGTLYFYISTSNIIYVIIDCLIIGLFLIPGGPLMMELTTEITYPIGESLIIGVLIASGQLMGVFLGYVGGLICKG